MSVIQVRNLSKRYRIGLKESRKDTFVGQVGAVLRAPIDNFRKLRSLGKFKDDDESVFWALRDINFDVQQGEVLSIIGHNGAGKSTLLKILSRITEPTSGEVRIKGRVAALLEVGTGFHQELTGRENIYMNGTILGMTRREIDRKLDEIVDFSGVEKYIDTPVKFYSSGMKVRLGFAVAAHLEPEILIIDEVLAVGDAEFQKKCLGKMEDVAVNEGRTVLYVSHNLNSVRALCTKGLLLNQGKIAEYGETDKVIHEYQKARLIKMPHRSWELSIAPGDDIVRLLSVKLVNEQLVETDQFDISEKIGISFDYEVLKNGFTIWAGFQLMNLDNVNIFDSHNVTSPNYNIPHKTGKFRTIAWIPNYLLAEGEYYFHFSFFNHITSKIHIYEKEVAHFSVFDDLNPRKINPRGRSPRNLNGLIKPLLHWDFISTDKIYI